MIDNNVGLRVGSRTRSNSKSVVVVVYILVREKKKVDEGRMDDTNTICTILYRNQE